MKKKTSVFILILLVLSPLLCFSGGQKELPAEVLAAGKEARDWAVEIANALGPHFGDLHEKIVSDGHRDSAAYAEFRDALAVYTTKFNVTYLYTLIKVSDKMTNLIVDAAEPEYADDYGAEYEMESQIASAFSGTPDYAKSVWEDDDFGWQISAFAPLYNSAGKIVAVIGVDRPVNMK